MISDIGKERNRTPNWAARQFERQQRVESGIL
jgi:hypothetical protein